MRPLRQQPALSEASGGGTSHGNLRTKSRIWNVTEKHMNAHMNLLRFFQMPLPWRCIANCRTPPAARSSCEDADSNHGVLTLYTFPIAYKDCVPSYAKLAISDERGTQHIAELAGSRKSAPARAWWRVGDAHIGAQSARL